MVSDARAERLQLPNSDTASSPRLTHSGTAPSEPVPVSGVQVRRSAEQHELTTDEADERRPGAVEGLFWVLRGYAVVGLLAGVVWMVGRALTL